MTSSMTAVSASARSRSPTTSTEPSDVATAASTPLARMTAAAATADQATARRQPSSAATAPAISGAISGAISTAVPRPPSAVTVTLPMRPWVSSSVAELLELVHVGPPEGQPHPGGEHLKHEHEEQQVERAPELDHERDPGRGKQRGRGDAVVEQQEADDLRQRVTAGHQDEEAEEHDGEPDGERARRRRWRERHEGPTH